MLEVVAELQEAGIPPGEAYVAEAVSRCQAKRGCLLRLCEQSGRLEWLAGFELTESSRFDYSLAEYEPSSPPGYSPPGRCPSLLSTLERARASGTALKSIATSQEVLAPVYLASVILPPLFVFLAAPVSDWGMLYIEF
ncbi:MAG: hypothetical protein AMXMBFR33_39070 [Candidatus Xenobia bacterium]